MRCDDAPGESRVDGCCRAQLRGVRCSRFGYLGSCLAQERYHSVRRAYLEGKAGEQATYPTRHRYQRQLLLVSETSTEAGTLLQEMQV